MVTVRVESINKPRRIKGDPSSFILHPSSFIGAVARRWLALRFRVLGRRYGRLVIEEVDGVPLIVLPEVFNPVLLRSGAFMAHTMRSLWREDDRPMRVLDMGTGSGVGAIFAAHQGAQVVAVDINPEAVRCAQLNALLNHLEDKIEVRQGDLFAPVAGQQFDLILFNPPYHRGAPRNNLDHAWRGQDVFERFAAGLCDALTPKGRALLVLSSDGDCQDMLDALAAHGFTPNVFAQQNLFNEILTMYSVANI